MKSAHVFLSIILGALIPLSLGAQQSQAPLPTHTLGGWYSQESQVAAESISRRYADEPTFATPYLTIVHIHGLVAAENHRLQQLAAITPKLPPHELERQLKILAGRFNALQTHLQYPTQNSTSPTPPTQSLETELTWVMERALMLINTSTGQPNYAYRLMRTTFPEDDWVIADPVAIFTLFGLGIGIFELGTHGFSILSPLLVGILIGGREALVLKPVRDGVSHLWDLIAFYTSLRPEFRKFIRLTHTPGKTGAEKTKAFFRFYFDLRYKVLSRMSPAANPDVTVASLQTLFQNCK